MSLVGSELVAVTFAVSKRPAGLLRAAVALHCAALAHMPLGVAIEAGRALPRGDAAPIRVVADPAQLVAAASGAVRVIFAGSGLDAAPGVVVASRALGTLDHLTEPLSDAPKAVADHAVRLGAVGAMGGCGDVSLKTPERR